MTLSRWIRDYICFPITTKHRGTPLRFYLSLLGVMALVGLWHGAGWGFMVWGLLHGLYMVSYRAFESAKQSRPKIADYRAVAVAWRILTLVAIVVAWVPFRAPDLGTAARILQSMVSRLSTATSFGPMFYAFTSLVVLFCAIEPFLIEQLRRIEESMRFRPALSRVLARPFAYTCALLLFIIFSSGDVQFIYLAF